MAAWLGHSSGKLVVALEAEVRSCQSLELMPAIVAPSRKPERGPNRLLLLLLFLLPVAATGGSTSSSAQHPRDGVATLGAKQLLPSDQLNNGLASEQLAGIVLHQWPPNEATTYLGGPATSSQLNIADKTYYLARREPALEEAGEPEVEEEEEEEEDVEEEEEDDQDDYNDYGAYIIYDTASSSPGFGAAAATSVTADVLGQGGTTRVMQSKTGDRQVVEGARSSRPAALIFFAATRAPRPQASLEQVAAKMDRSSNQSAFKAPSLSYSRRRPQQQVSGKAHQMGRQDQSSGGNSTEIKKAPGEGEVASRAGRARRHQASLAPTRPAPAQATGPVRSWPLEAATLGPTAVHIKWLSKMNGRLATDQPPQSSGKQTETQPNSIDNDKGDYIEASQHMFATDQSSKALSNQAAILNHNPPASAAAGPNHVSTTLSTAPSRSVGASWINNTELIVTQAGPEHVTAAPQAAALSLGEPPTASRAPKHNVYYWRLIWFILPLGATFGNLLVIIAVYLERSLQSVTNYFIVSLAFADLFVGLIVMPFAVYVLVNEVWELSDTICDIFVAVDVTSSTASILNLVAISIDRYRAVAYPIAYTTSSSSTIAVLTICGVWLISSAVGTPIIFGLNTTPGRRSDLCILYNSTFIFWSSLASFYIPCIVMIALYWRVFSAIKSRTKKALQASEYKATGGFVANQQQRKQPATIEYPGQVQTPNKMVASLPARQIVKTTQQPPSPAPTTQKPTNTSTPVNKAAHNGLQQKSHEPPLHQANSSSIKPPLSLNDGSKCSLRRNLCGHNGCEEQLKLLSKDSMLDSSCWQLALKPVAACECAGINEAPGTCIRNFISILETSALQHRNIDLLDLNQLNHITALMGALWRMRGSYLDATDNHQAPLLKTNSSSVSLADGVFSVSLEFSGSWREAGAPEVDSNTCATANEMKLLEQVAIPKSCQVKVLLSEHCRLKESSLEREAASSGLTQQYHQQQILCPCCRRATSQVLAGPKTQPPPVIPAPATVCLFQAAPTPCSPSNGNEQLPLKLNKITLLSSNGATTKQPLMMIAYARLNLELKQDTCLMICIHRWPVDDSHSSRQGPDKETFKCRIALGSQLCDICLASCSLCSLLVLGDAAGSELAGPPISCENPLKETVVEECVHLSRLLKVERATSKRQHLSNPNRVPGGDLELSNSDHLEVSGEGEEEDEVGCPRDALSEVSSNSSAMASSLSHSSSSSTNFRFGSDFFSGSSTNQPNCHLHHRAQLRSGDCCAGSPPPHHTLPRELQPTTLCASCTSQQHHQESQMAPPGDNQSDCCHCEHRGMIACLPDESEGRRQKARFEATSSTTNAGHRVSSSMLSGRRPTGGELLLASTGKQELAASKLANQQQAANLLQNATQTIKRRSMRLSQLIRSKRSRGKQANYNKEQVDSNSTAEATNSDAEDLYSSSQTPFGSSALACKSATLISSQYTSTTPTTTIVPPPSVSDGAPKLVLEQAECCNKQLELIVATQLTEDKNSDNKDEQQEYNNKRGLTQVVVASTQKDEDPQQHKFIATNQIHSASNAEATQKKNTLARKQPSQRHRVAGSKRRREKNAAKRERKATKTLAIVLGIFLICWTPFFTCNIIDGVCIQLNMDCRPGMMVYTITSWLGYINSCVNPIIYTIFNMEFRRAFKKIICIRSK